MAKKTRPAARRCHDCGGILIRDTRPFEFAYKGESITVDQPGWYCRKCGEGVLTGDDIAVTDPAFMELKARVDGVLTPREVRRIRTKLKLTQRRAADLLGGGPKAFQKYESGEVGVSQAMSNLLRLLDRDPSLLQALEPGQAA